MENSFEIRIASPCSENWNRMQPNTNGRHCGKCQKTVVDFSTKSTEEIQHYFKYAQGATCGRFNTHQVTHNPTSWQHALRNYRRQVQVSTISAFPKILYLTMLSICLFVVSCDWKGSSNHHTVGDTVYVDSAQAKKLNQQDTLPSEKITPAQ
jgi:hypothetical protein